MKNILEFIPRSNKWFKSIQTVSFTIAGSFVFVEKNIFQFYFRSFSKVTTLLFLKAKQKMNFVGKKLKSRIVFLAKSHPILRIKTKARALLKLNIESSNAIHVKIIAKPTLTLSYKPKKSSLRITNSAKPIAHVFYKVKNTKMVVRNLALANTTIATESKENKIRIFSRGRLKSDIFVKSKQSFQAGSSAKISQSFLFHTIKGTVAFQSTAKARVYRPIQLSTLYPDKIEDWYSKSLEDVFYGQEIF